MTKTEQPDEITGTFAEISRALLAEGTVGETLRRIVQLAVETVEGCDYSAVSVVELGGDMTTPAASHEIGAQCDALQHELNEGPCLGAISDLQTFEIEDLSTEDRWPGWVPAAMELGAASMISFRLFVRESTLGALNLYSARPRAFDDVDRATGAIFASHASVALSGAQRQARADRAIVVAKATGMIMERRGIDSEQALDLLKRAAARMQVKLQSVAERVVERRRPGI